MVNFVILLECFGICLTFVALILLLNRDGAIIRKVARNLLKNYAFDLVEAESGPEAIEMVRQTRYDIILMDHMTPMMDGIEAAEIIRRDCGENGTANAIIALTANAMEGVREQLLKVFGQVLQ